MAAFQRAFFVAQAFLPVFLLFPIAASAQTPKPPTYDDDVKPVFRRRCFGCHSSAESRAGLSLETYAGILKGGGSGDIVLPGRASNSLLYKVVAHEGDGVPRMPLNGAKIPDSEIAIIQEWIQRGLLETATSMPKGPTTSSVEFKASDLNRPVGPPAMPKALPPVAAPEPPRPHPITALAASPWAPLIAVAGHERIYLYDTINRTALGALPFPEGIPYVLRFSRDGSTLLAGGGRGVQSGMVVLYDVRTGARRAVVGKEMDIVLAADVSADGKLVALGGPGKIVKVFTVADGKLAYQITKHTDWITAIAFSPDGSRLATGDRAGGIHLWESATGGIVVSLSDHKDAITSLSWRGDGALLASGSEDGQIIIWSAVDGFPAATISPKPVSGVESLDFTPDGRLVSVARDNKIRFWSSDGKPKEASAAYDALLTKVVARYDSKLAIAGDYRGRILLWDGKLSATIGPQELVTQAKAR
jgi:Planctomycete cytochrome C/WD domain, G-beta repeat